MSVRFINIDHKFYIRYGLDDLKFNKCISYIVNHNGPDPLLIKKIYKNNSHQIIKLPDLLLKKKIDIVIKTKINKDYKFIDLENYEVIHKYYDQTKLFLDKVKYLKLEKLEFFPPNYQSDDFIIEKLAIGKIYNSENFLTNKHNVQKNIAAVVNVLSSLNNNEIKLKEYIEDLGLVTKQDPLNLKIIEGFILNIKNEYDSIIKTSLTHGDFKFEHMLVINDKLEFLIDWEKVGIRTIYFDMFNFFVPWFVYRKHNYNQIKDFIKNFINSYTPKLSNYFDKYDLYFSIFALERYSRMINRRSESNDISLAYERYNFIFSKLIN